jgi:hypothetical protein
MSRRWLGPPPRAGLEPSSSRRCHRPLASAVTATAGDWVGGRTGQDNEWLGFHRDAFLSLSRGMLSGRIIAGRHRLHPRLTDTSHAHPADRVDQTARGLARSVKRVKMRRSITFASVHRPQWRQVGTGHAAMLDASGHRPRCHAGCKWAMALGKWETVPPSDHWVQRARGPPVIDL